MLRWSFHLVLSRVVSGVLWRWDEGGPFVGQVSELRGETIRLQTEKEELERELDTQTNHTHKQVSNTLSVCLQQCESGYNVCVCVCVQVSMLQCQVHTSEALLQDIQKAFSQSQNAVQSRLVSDTTPTDCLCWGCGFSLLEKVYSIYPYVLYCCVSSLGGDHLS